jgi:ZIP family zinc transporter
LVFFAGAFTFFLADKLIGKFGAKDRMDLGSSKSVGLIIPMVLAIILDGIPESIVLGLGMFPIPGCLLSRLLQEGPS